MREVGVTISVAEWRARNGPQEVELPSGNVALLRRVHLLDLAAEGVIPATLVAEVEKLRDTSGTQFLQDQKTVHEFREMLNAVAKATFVEPPLGDEATEAQLGVDEVPFEDRLFVFNWCSGRVQQLEPFRAEPEGDVDASPDGEDVRAAAELDPGD